MLYNPSPARSWLLFPPECGFREVLAWVLSPILGAFGNEGWRCYQEFICTDCYLISWQKASKHFFFFMDQRIRDLKPYWPITEYFVPPRFIS